MWYTLTFNRFLMSTNISKQKRDDLISKINKIREYLLSAKQDENTENLLSYLGEITKEINGKKYGLVFEEHQEKIDEILEENVPYLEEQDDLFVNNGGETNFLIEGDNLAALQLLEKTHKGKIDVIYIDPPYNTQNEDFIYDDIFVDSTDMFRHSKWLSFMQKRLKLAYKLLSDSGMIWISIDENELFDLKLLCDEIFSSSNFRSLITIIANPGGRDYGGIAKTTEYVLIFSKTEKSTIEKISSEEHFFNLKDEFGSFELRELRNRNTKFNDKNRPNLCYPFYVNPNDIDEHGLNSVSLEKTDLYSVEVYPLKSQGIQTVWRWGKEEKSRENLNKNVKAKKKKDGTYMIVEKYRDENVMLKNIWNDKKFRTENGSLQLKAIFGDKIFSYPKPLDIVETLLRTQPYSSTILDFFAGSGTTGHAVLKLNAEDGGHRKFILCTNNENNICREITYERLKTVITGNRKDGSKYSDGLAGSLKYLKINYLPIKEKMYYEYADELLEHIRALVELENAVNLGSEKSVAIVLDDEELDEFVDSLDENSTCKKLYMGHDVLASAAQERKLKANGISVNIVPEYYYPDLDF